MSRARNLAAVAAYTPVNQAGDTLSGNLIVSGSLLKARVMDGSKVLSMGQWDGTTNRVESSGADLLLMQYGAGNKLRLSHASSGDFLVADAAGRVTKPLQPAWCFTGTSYSQSSTGAYSTVIPATTIFNTGSHFDGATGLFWAPVDGTYFFNNSGLLYPFAETDTLNTLWMKNGATVHILQVGGNHVSHGSYSSSIMLKLTAGQSVGFQLLTPVGSTVKAYGGQWIMSGHLVC